MKNYIKQKIDIIYRRIRIFPPYQFFSSALFMFFNYRYKTKKKVFYCLVPPPELRNIGDHAQAVTIRIWLSQNFPDYQIFELNKNKSRSSYWIWVIKKILSPDDLFFIHSGGNLSDRALWSEGGRRKIINSFQQNLVCVLPQTIYFSDTKKGKKELEKTKNIYNKHPNLIITGRDLQSEELAQKYFKNATVISCPDFVLLYNLYYKKDYHRPKEDILFCFRNDSESALNKKERGELLKSASKYKIDEFDTTIDNYIYKKKEQLILDKTIWYFSKFRIVVTDRYHGLIFSILAKRPCIILPTIDHKLTAAYTSWFNNMDGIYLSQNVNQAKIILNRTIQKPDLQISKVDWNKKYFHRYTNKIMSNDSIY